MEHLLYVLWHDYWKPWLIDLAYIGFAAGAVLGIALTWIMLTLYVGRLIGN